MFVYRYSVSNNFIAADNNINIRTLISEIASAVTQEPSYIEHEIDNCNIGFLTQLTSQNKINLDQAIAIHIGTSDQIQKSNSRGTSGTTSQSPQNKIQLTSLPLKEGDYIISWYSEIRINGALGGTVAAEVIVDGIQIGTTTWTGTDWHIFSGALRQIFSEGAKPTIVLRFYRSAGLTGTAEIRRSDLYITR